MRRILIGTAVVLVVAVAVLFVLMPGLMTGSAQTSSDTTFVQRVTLDETVSGTGVISAERTAYLTFGTSGTVDTVTAEVGQTVREGEELATLDTIDLELQVALREDALRIAQLNYDQLTQGASERELAQARASTAAAESQLTSARTARENVDAQITASCAGVITAGNVLETARTAYDHYVEQGFALDPNFVADPNAEPVIMFENAQASYDAAQAQCATATNTQMNTEASVAAAEANLVYAQEALADLTDGADPDQIAITEAQVRQAQTQLEQAQAALDRARLVAPFDGVITAVNIELGQTATLSAAAITLADTSAYHLSVDVDELDVMRLEVGQTASIELQSLDGQAFAGTVARIAPAANVGQGVATYNVRIDLVTGAAAPTLRTEPTPAIPDGVGQGTRFNQFLPVFQALGGVEGLNALATQPDGNAQFIAALREADIEADLIAQIEAFGGLTAVVDLINANTGSGSLASSAALAQVPETAPDPAAVPVTLRIGMTADVEIVVGTYENVFAVSSEAVQRSGDQEYLIAADGTEIPVTTGISRDGLTVVYGDLSDGQTVYIQPPTSRVPAIGSGAALSRLSGGAQ